MGQLSKTLSKALSQVGKGDGGAAVSSEFPWGKASAVVPGAHPAVCEALEHILFP